MQGDFRLGVWLVQPTLTRVSRDGATVHLRAKVMDLLVFLAARPGEVVSKDALLNGVWGTEFISESALTRVVTELRHALGDDVDHPQILETIPKRGYRLIAPVLTAGRTEPSAPPHATSKSPPGQLFSPAGVDSASAAQDPRLRAEEGNVKPAALRAGSARWPGSREEHRRLLLGAFVREWTKKDESVAGRKPRRWIWYGSLAALAFAAVLIFTLAYVRACSPAERGHRAPGAEGGYLDPTFVAIPHIGLGERDEELAWPEKAHAQRSVNLIGVRQRPWFDSLHADPRFQDLVRRVGLKP